MARNPDGIIQTIWAEGGDKANPPFARETGWPAEYSQDGGPGPSRLTMNQRFFELDSLAKEINQNGSTLPWDNRVNYTALALVFATDNILYRALLPNGPDLPAGVKDPATDDGSTWTEAFPSVRAPIVIGHSASIRFDVPEDATYLIMMWGAGGGGGDATNTGGVSGTTSMAVERIDGSGDYYVTGTAEAGRGGSSGTSFPTGEVPAKGQITQSTVDFVGNFQFIESAGAGGGAGDGGGTGGSGGLMVGVISMLAIDVVALGLGAGGALGGSNAVRGGDAHFVAVY